MYIKTHLRQLAPKVKQELNVVIGETKEELQCFCEASPWIECLIWLQLNKPKLKEGESVLDTRFYCNSKYRQENEWYNAEYSSKWDDTVRGDQIKQFCWKFFVYFVLKCSVEDAMILNLVIIVRLIGWISRFDDITVVWTCANKGR